VLSIRLIVVELLLELVESSKNLVFGVSKRGQSELKGVTRAKGSG
jgi:hypothetical protein